MAACGGDSDSGNHASRGGLHNGDDRQMGSRRPRFRFCAAGHGIRLFLWIQLPDAGSFLLSRLPLGERNEGVHPEWIHARQQAARPGSRPLRHTQLRQIQPVRLFMRPDVRAVGELGKRCCRKRQAFLPDVDHHCASFHRPGAGGRGDVLCGKTRGREDPDNRRRVVLPGTLSSFRICRDDYPHRQPGRSACRTPERARGLRQHSDNHLFRQRTGRQFQLSGRVFQERRSFQVPQGMGQEQPA